MTESQKLTLFFVKKEMDLPRVAMSARKALIALASLEELLVKHNV
jgi:hypothetical protein